MFLLACYPASLCRFGWGLNRFDPRTLGPNMMGHKLPKTNPQYRSPGLHFSPRVVELLFIRSCWSFFSYTATSPNIKKPKVIGKDGKISLNDSTAPNLWRLDSPSPLSTSYKCWHKQLKCFCWHGARWVFSVFVGTSAGQTEQPQVQTWLANTFRNQPTIQVTGFALQGSQCPH